MKLKIIGQIPHAKSRTDPEHYQAILNIKNRIQSEYPDLHTLVITSRSAGEGKSTITEELAYAFAENGSVLAIDADPYKSSLFGHLPGVSEFMSGVIDSDALLHNVSKVHFLCPGQRPPGDKGYVNEMRITELIAAVSSSYDYILIDTPPLFFFHDAKLIAKHCDGLILVQRCMTARDTIDRNTAEELKGLPLIGTIINNVKIKQKDGAYLRG